MIQFFYHKVSNPVLAQNPVAQNPGVEPGSLQDYEIEDTLASPEDEWASLWEETRKTKGKLTVSSGHRVGWLHDVIQTTPFCELRVTSERRSDSILSICEGAKGIIVNTRIDQVDASHFRSLFVSIKQPRSLVSRSGRKLPITINILSGVEPGSHRLGCSVGPGPHYAMAASADSSVQPMTVALLAEKLTPYRKTYLSTVDKSNVGPGPHDSRTASTESVRSPTTTARSTEKSALCKKTYFSESSNHTSFIQVETGAKGVAQLS